MRALGIEGTYLALPNVNDGDVKSGAEAIAPCFDVCDAEHLRTGAEDNIYGR